MLTDGLFFTVVMLWRCANMLTALDVMKLGVYTEACRKFAEQVRQLPEIKAVKAYPHGDYVDLWVIVESAHLSEATKKVSEIFVQVWRRFPDLLLDLMVTDEEPTTLGVELFRREGGVSHASSS